MYLIDSSPQVHPWASLQTPKEILTAKKAFLALPEDLVNDKYRGIRKFILLASKLSYEETPDYKQFEMLIREMED